MPVGLTKDAGWQIGVSRTFPVAVGEAWDALLSPEGIAIWLGAGAELVKGEEYATADGTRGEVRSLRTRDRLRVTWQPAARERPATVQVTVRPAKSGCTVRFHTDRLDSAEEREAMREHWRQAIERLGALLHA